MSYKKYKFLLLIFIYIYTDYIKNGLRTVDLRNVSIDSRNSETNNKHSSNNYVLYEIVE